MTTLRLILSDHLSHNISSLNDTKKETDIVMLAETKSEATHVPHHKKKLAFLFAAMAHFATELEEQGHKVHHILLDNPANTQTLSGEVARAIDLYGISKIVVTYPPDHRLLTLMTHWSSDFGLPIDIRDDDRFLCTAADFENWSDERKTLRMEYFYREMRQKYGILLNDDKPVGGQWNYDADNRKPPKDGLKVPGPYYKEPDTITQAAISRVAKAFEDHFGDLHPFYFAVNRDEALQALDLFIEQRLPNFGTYQDAMIEGEPWMYHSHISFYLNCGLLMPLDCTQAAERAYYDGSAPLNAVEGFIRQIIGWREYVRGIYWLKMPDYKSENFFDATRPLPDFYWTANTKMNCLRQCITETKNNAYAHHIQRLMVLGNFALLAGLDPNHVNEWYLVVYADAFEWVELPNVLGMILFADGGYLASKPYAAGGNYINKMSNYCKNCTYKVSQKTGPNACPFNYLYWDFLARNRDKLSTNHRIGMMYKTYDRMDQDKKNTITQDSQIFLDTLKPWVDNSKTCK